MSAIEIRAERPDDHEPIAEVVGAAFGSEREAELVAAIRASPEFVAEWSLVAVVEGRIVGHVMGSYARLHDGGDPRPIAMLSPLAVAPDHQGAGVGAALVAALAERVDAAGEPVLVLEGSPVYYGRLGFEPAAGHAIELPLPDWAPPAAAQVLRLGHDDPGVRGTVVYPPAFDAVTDH